LAKSRLAGAKGDWNGVLAVLGEAAGQVPIHEGFVANLTARRADAWERLGRLDMAVSSLVAGMQANPVHRNSIGMVVKAHGICPASYPMAEGQLAALEGAAQARAQRRGGGPGARVAIVLMLLVLAGVLMTVVLLSR